MSETRERLLDAAERLFAEKGLQGTSTREIVAAAGQRNESAIQYHFGGRAGLIDALHLRRLEEVEAARHVRLDALEAEDASPDVRALLACLIRPVLERCRGDAGFRAYIGVFGQIALSPGIELAANRFEIESVGRVRGHLLPMLELPDAVLRDRVEALTRFVLLNLSQWARSEARFEGPAFERFVHNTMDMMVGLLTVGASDETLAAYGARGGKARGRRGETS